METSPDKIVSKFGLPNDIPKDIVREWMQSNDIEALGAVYSFIINRKYAERIVPRLTYDEYSNFLMLYFERCLRDNPDGDWSDSRYAASRGFASWFGTLWYDKTVGKESLAQLRDWLATIYIASDESVRRCIVDGALEHLFENREIAHFFLNWAGDPQLQIAYTEAIDWSTKPTTKPEAAHE